MQDTVAYIDKERSTGKIHGRVFQGASHWWISEPWHTGKRAAVRKGGSINKLPYSHAHKLCSLCLAPWNHHQSVAVIFFFFLIFLFHSLRCLFVNCCNKIFKHQNQYSFFFFFFKFAVDLSNANKQIHWVVFNEHKSREWEAALHNIVNADRSEGAAHPPGHATVHDGIVRPLEQPCAATRTWPRA